MIYFDLAAMGAGDLLDSSVEVADWIANNWQDAWDTLITPDSALWAALSTIAELFAVGAVMIFGVSIIKDWHESGNLTFVPELIWPLLVAFVLAGNGAVLASFDHGVRNVINETNNLVLTHASSKISLQEAYDQAKNNVVAQKQVGDLIKKCEALSGEKQMNCLAEAKANAEEIIKAYKLEGTWASNLLDRMGSAISEAGKSGGSVVLAPFAALIGAAQTGITEVILISMQMAWQALLEVTLLLTALLAPLALAGSILPYGTKPIFAWLTAMFALGIAKLCFNIMVGVTATIVATASAGDPLWYLLFSAVLAPFVAFGLAAGGGMAVFTSLADGSVMLVKAGAMVFS